MCQAIFYHFFFLMSRTSVNLFCCIKYFSILRGLNLIFKNLGNQFDALGFLAFFLNYTYSTYFFSLSTFAWRNLLLISYGSLGYFSGALERTHQPVLTANCAYFFIVFGLQLLSLCVIGPENLDRLFLYISLLIFLILLFSLCFDWSLVLFYWPAALD